METVESTPAVTKSRSRHWLLFLAGMALIFLGPVAYVLQIRAKNLQAPWYVPILATLGVGLMVASIWCRRGIARTIVLALFLIVCGLEWQMLLVEMRSPAYTGPAQPGRKVPAFTAKFADGAPFTEKDLEKGSRTVLVFYRGHW